ncbi:MAG: spore maturation protein [Planctomycetaceae bacterium]|nr:spore maturation protein [Planctomycetaceae bacterium]
MSGFQEFAGFVSQWTLPATILLIVVWGAWRRVPMYESFITGAKEGFSVAVMIIPYLVAILFAIKIFVAGGIFEDMKLLAEAVLRQFDMERFAQTFDLLPLAFTRPLSGSGARGVMLEIFDQHGPDSFLGQTASLMMGSTETTFYVLTVYFGSVNISKIRHTLSACLIADVAGVIASLFLGYALYGHLAAAAVAK